MLWVLPHEKFPALKILCTRLNKIFVWRLLGSRIGFLVKIEAFILITCQNGESMRDDIAQIPMLIDSASQSHLLLLRLMYSV